MAKRKVVSMSMPPKSLWSKPDKLSKEASAKQQLPNLRNKIMSNLPYITKKIRKILLKISTKNLKKLLKIRKRLENSIPGHFSAIKNLINFKKL